MVFILLVIGWVWSRHPLHICKTVHWEQSLSFFQYVFVLNFTMDHFSHFSISSVWQWSSAYWYIIEHRLPIEFLDLDVLDMCEQKNEPKWKDFVNYFEVSERSLMINQIVLKLISLLWIQDFWNSSRFGWYTESESHWFHFCQLLHWFGWSANRRWRWNRWKHDSGIFRVCIEYNNGVWLRSICYVKVLFYRYTSYSAK